MLTQSKTDPGSLNSVILGLLFKICQADGSTTVNFFPRVLAAILLECQLQMLCHINIHNHSLPHVTYTVCMQMFTLLKIINVFNFTDVEQPPSNSAVN